MAEQQIGTITHYFGKVGVAAIGITEGELRVGDTIHVVGHTSDFTQVVESLQLDNLAVEIAKPGQTVGVKVPEHARQHDKVFVVARD
jgi:GTPase